MSRHLGAAVAMAAALSIGQLAHAVPITVINPGGEAYPTGPNTLINPGGVAPLATTGWNSTVAATVGEEGVEGINNQAAAVVGENMRLAFGAVNSATGDDDTNQSSDFALYQETGYTPAENDVLSLGFIGRAFFQFDVGTDVQTSFFGYVDGGNVVQVDAQEHATTVPAVWTPALPHVHAVLAGSPLIGRSLVIGFFTDTPDAANGGFTSVDNVTLDVTPIPEPAAWAMGWAGAAGVGAFRRRRRRMC